MAFIGPVQLYEKANNTEKTSAQIISNLTHDSRVYPLIYPLTNVKIRELRKDPTVQLARWAVLAPMIHTPWVYAATNIGNHIATPEMINFVSDVFTPLRDWFLAQAVFGTLDYGWQPFEVVQKPENGTVIIEDFKALLQDYTTVLVYLDSGQFAGFVNEPLQLAKSTIIELQYSFNTNFSIEGTDWYGYSVFESLNSVITSWNDVEKTANRYDRKIAGANWIIYYPVSQTMYNGVLTANDVIANDLLKKLEASGAVAIPDDIQDWMDDVIDKEAKGKWRIELLTANTSTQTSFIDRQKYLDALKMRAFGLPERSILEGKHGTKEEADVHADIALSIVDSKHRLLCNQINTGPLRFLMRLNFGKKFEKAVCIKPAPLVDNQFATIKEIYRMILQTPDALLQEVPNIDLKGMRDELGIPSSGLNNQPKLPKIEEGEGDGV